MLLKNFRCHRDFDSFSAHDRLTLHKIANNWTHISGANGCGKTSILEAISFLSPGRGMRGASIDEVTSVGSSEPWHARFVFDDDRTLTLAHVQHHNSEYANCKNAVSVKGFRRVIKDNTGEIAWHKHISVLSITPQSATKFFLSKQERRLCMDRWVGSVISEYYRVWCRYHTAHRHWLKCCRSSVRNSAVFEAFEEVMIREGTKISEMRTRWKESMRMSFAQNIEIVSCDVANVDWKYARSRASFDGPHSADLRIAEKRDHSLCSTGEQKMMFFNAVNSVLRMQHAEHKFLLLDDWYENFDAANRARISELLMRTENLSVWSSGLMPIEVVSVR